METISTITEVVRDLWFLFTVVVFFVKPIRERLLGSRSRERDKEEATRCNLRSNMLEIYYKGVESKSIHIYDYENFTKLYDVYKKLGGNSFIDEVHDKIEEWEVIV